MHQAKTAGIMETLMSVLTLAAVRSRGSHPRRARRTSLGTPVEFLAKKESYFAMLQFSRWKQ
jgi:hypothetical protein